MKSIVTIFFLILPIFLLAQSYTPLLEPQKVWTVEYADYVIIPPEVEQHQYFYIKDTIINNITYGSYKEYIFLREDTINQKVYFVETLNARDECLLYDFSAQPGDTVQNCDHQFIIDSVSTITLPGGSVRKIWFYSGGIGDQFYIEGIGSSAGFLELSQLIGPPSIELMCVRKNGEYLYGERCDEVTSAIQIKPSSFQVRVFPNPVSSVLMVETEQQVDQFRLVQLNGQVVLSAAFPKSGILQLEHLDNGYYILELYADKQQLLGTSSIILQK